MEAKGQEMHVFWYFVDLSGMYILCRNEGIMNKYLQLIFANKL